jgi:hypothetical protein
VRDLPALCPPTNALPSRKADLHAQLAAKDARIAEQDARIAEQDALLAQQSARMAEQDAKIALLGIFRCWHDYPDQRLRRDEFQAWMVPVRLQFEALLERAARAAIDECQARARTCSRTVRQPAAAFQMHRRTVERSRWLSDLR